MPIPVGVRFEAGGIVRRAGEVAAGEVLAVAAQAAADAHEILRRTRSSRRAAARAQRRTPSSMMRVASNVSLWVAISTRPTGPSFTRGVARSTGGKAADVGDHRRGIVVAQRRVVP